MNFIDYWNNRYNNGGTSGSGSYGLLANYKSNFINKFILKNNINKVIEFGCGDGNQLSLLSNYSDYIGLDISINAIEICKNKFKNDSTKQFLLYNPNNFNNNLIADLTLSLDVIYHILDDELYVKHMEHLFMSSSKYVIIYSSNFKNKTYAKHILHRKFTDWIKDNITNFVLEDIVYNDYKYDPKNENTTSLSDFYVYKSKESKSK